MNRGFRLLTINLLQALPKTPLWDRLERENRLIDDDSRDSNVDFLLPYDQVVSSWKKCMEAAYQPEKLFSRYQYQCEYTYARRLKMPVSAEQKSWVNIRRGLIMLRNIFWKVGVLGDYRKAFWKFALRRLRFGDIEGLIGSAMIAHHLIVFARAASGGRQNASNYSLRLREAAVPAELIRNETAGAVVPFDARLRELTPARVALGLAGASMPTEALLEFTLDHARARDAVHALFDVPGLISGLSELGVQPVEVSSRAGNRKDISGVPIWGEHSTRLRSICWRVTRATGAGLRSLSATACRRRRSMRMRLHWSAALFRDWPTMELRSAMPWLQPVRGSHWAMRSAPFLGRA